MKSFCCACFFFLIVFKNFLKVPLPTENNKLALALAIPTGATMALVNEVIEATPLSADKSIKF